MTGDFVLVETRNLARRAQAQDNWLLRDVSLTICGGERMAIVGSSGAGKTVLLRALAMLDPIDHGELLWEGQRISGQRVPEYRRHVMYLQQRPALVQGTVEANLRLPFSLSAHKHRVFDRSHAQALLNELGRGPDFMNTRHSNLSGGEAQIVALLRAILLKPQVLLLDEPTASLDATTAAAVETMVADWFAELPAERATVWVSHDQARARRIANRVIRVEDTTAKEIQPA